MKLEPTLDYYEWDKELNPPKATKLAKIRPYIVDVLLIGGAIVAFVIAMVHP